MVEFHFGACIICKQSFVLKSHNPTLKRLLYLIHFHIINRTPHIQFPKCSAPKSSLHRIFEYFLPFSSSLQLNSTSPDIPYTSLQLAILILTYPSSSFPLACSILAASRAHAVRCPLQQCVCVCACAKRHYAYIIVN